MNFRVFTSVYARHFSEESNAKRRRLEVEERRLLLEERAQIMDMVKFGIYTPRSARRKIERIDKRTESSTLDNGDMLIGSPLGSQDRFQTLSPSPDRQSPTWSIEDPGRSLDDTEEEI